MYRVRSRLGPYWRCRVNRAEISTTARACLEAVFMAAGVYVNIIIWGCII